MEPPSTASDAVSAMSWGWPPPVTGMMYSLVSGVWKPSPGNVSKRFSGLARNNNWLLARLKCGCSAELPAVEMGVGAPPTLAVDNPSVAVLYTKVVPSADQSGNVPLCENSVTVPPSVGTTEMPEVLEP